MAIFLNDDIECRKAEPLDTRVRVPNQAGLIALNPLYNYIGMLVITLDTLGVYQLTVNDGTTASDWELKTFYTDALVNTFLTDGSVSSVVFGTDTSLIWNPTDFTLDMPLNGVTVQLGQETVARILNNTGSTLLNGKVVRVTGASGQRLTAALADNSSDITSATILGIMTQDVLNNQQGFATLAGLVRNLNTSSFAEGDVLYLGSSGAVTNVKPLTPLHLVTVGYCVRSHATLGSIFAHPQNGYELDELHDVLITSAQNNDVLSWNSTGSYWENVALPSAPVTSVNGDVGVVVLDTDNINEGSSNLYYTESRVSLNTSVAANTAKISFDSASSTRLANTSGINTGDQDLSNLVDLTTNQSIGGDKIFTGATVAGSLAAYRPVINKTASFTLSATELNKGCKLDITTAVVISVDASSDSAFPIGGEIEFYWYSDSGSNTITITASGGQTVVSADAAITLSKVGSCAVLKKVAASSWILTGGLA
jgi:hypothetical protein